MSGEIISTGSVGQPDFERSEGRAYCNSDQRFDDTSAIIGFFERMEQEALQKTDHEGRQLSRRRTVLRAHCSEMVARELMRKPDVPLEVAYPLSLISPNSSEWVVMLGRNIHESDVPEWGPVYEYWSRPNGGRSPFDRVSCLGSRFQFIDRPQAEMARELAELWRVFGWSEAGVQSFIEKYEQNSSLFSGIVDLHTNKLVSACMAEFMPFLQTNLVETTEYATAEGYEGLGLCTSAVVALIAQVLHRTYYQDGQMPLITAEFNMSSRSDIVGRHAGMTIPLVEETSHLHNHPLQVLRYNVSVMDGLQPNDIKWRDLGEDRQRYRHSYRTAYRYWRNFIVGLLPLRTVQDHYTLENVQSILARIAP